MLLFSGFFAIAGVTSGLLELVYIGLLAVLTLCVLLLMARYTLAREVQTVPGINVSGPVQALLLGAGGVLFAQILAHLGTTIGGESPDSVIEIAFRAKTFSFTPWMCFVGSAVIVALIMLLKARRADVWERIAAPVRRAYAWADAQYARLRVGERTQGWCMQGKTKADSSLAGLEARVARLTIKESGILILACFVVTLIVLF